MISVIGGLIFFSDLQPSTQDLMRLFRNLSLLGIAARVTALAFALFISIFAMDVFGEELGFWKTIAALVVHLLPSFFIIVVLLVSWRFEWVGAFVFLILGVMYVFTRQADPLAYLLIAGPLFLAGLLFLFSWIQHLRSHKHLDAKG